MMIMTEPIQKARTHLRSYHYLTLLKVLTSDIPKLTLRIHAFFKVSWTSPF
jgi:hypothetical protein